MDDGRRCALPGCGERITTTDGRPERRYCTAAHRLAARRARRAAGATGRRADPCAPALPWLCESADASLPDRRPEPVRTAADSTAPARSSHRRRKAVRPPGRRALVLLGVAGLLLVGGFAMSGAATANAGRDVAVVVRPVDDDRPRPGADRGEQDAATLRRDPPAVEQDATAPQRPYDPAPAGQPSDADRATMDELRERVTQVARDARRAQAALR